MSAATIWTVIIGLGLVTALIRYSFLGFLQGREVPRVVRRALAFVPAAAFPAIFMPMVLLDQHGGWAEPSRPIAGAIALAVGIASRSMLLAIVSGLVAILVLRQLGV
ncbi:AzlD domain-containing protein [Rhodobacteraceae bacterium NNCM2]|nr:AzlD domain-containing protein [Coraliihabitans acroporae]